MNYCCFYKTKKTVPLLNDYYTEMFSPLIETCFINKNCNHIDCEYKNNTELIYSLKNKIDNITYDYNVLLNLNQENINIINLYEKKYKKSNINKHHKYILPTIQE